MGTITLQNSSDTEVTILSNRFIDCYMPEANGDFVKIYIYLLRILSVSPASFSLEHMADCLLCTERDILRALRYWQKEKLLTLNFGPDKKLCGIILCRPEAAEAPAAMVQPAPAAAVLPDPAAAVLPGSAVSGGADSFSQDAVPKKLTPDRVKELKQNKDIVQLLYIAEQYLGKALTSTEMQKILFFYDGLKMSAGLIEYLIEYCVSRSHKSMRYIETVAMNWSQEGITTVAMAKEAGSRYGREYYAILKSMGISGRNPVETEVALMDTWMKDYRFDLSLIQEACSRTVLQTGQPSFQYADKILSGWREKNVKSLDDVISLDAEHKKRKLEKTVSKPQPKTNNRFNNFHQREYNFEEYEKHLLNPSKQ